MNILGKKTHKVTRKPSGKEPVHLTPRRKIVLEALMSSHSHPTVRELQQIIGSRTCLATIYNSLDYLRSVGLVNEHRLSSGPARFCVNTRPHTHLVDERSGRMIDVHLKHGVNPKDVFALPKGAKVTSVSAYLYGSIPDNL